MNFEELNFDDLGGGPSLNMDMGDNDGIGVELLMNPNAMQEDTTKYLRASRGNELNLNDMNANSGIGGLDDTYGGGGSGMLNIDDISTSVNFNETPDFIETNNNDKLWDNYGKYDTMPSQPQLTSFQKKALADEERIEKKRLIRKLNNLKNNKNCKVSKDYTEADSLDEMKAEYNDLENEIFKRRAVSYQKTALIYVVSTLEYFTSFYNPFDDVDFKGISEELEEKMADDDQFDDIFGELYEKYKSKINVLIPEFKLLGLVGGIVATSIIRKQMANKARSLLMGAGGGAGGGLMGALNQYPSVNEIMENSLMKDMLNQNTQNRQTMNMLNKQQDDVALGRGPPPPVRTRGEMGINADVAPPDITRGGNNVAFDTFAYKTPVNAGAGAGAGAGTDGGNRVLRQEMTGPKELNSILAGIKTKTIPVNGLGGGSLAQAQNNIMAKQAQSAALQGLSAASMYEQSQKQPAPVTQPQNIISMDEFSVISGGSNINLPGAPKRQRQKKQSTVSQINL